ncbi:hypothetical protein VP06_14450 [Methylobacterium aquaticum]|uniref:Uncharacterized protein n=1 Tax=Methylobacterium aquaticum TaxID=270351 RepID=A0A0J6V645_9HYPH|nr:hypothetical protein VP06_14450 [Methylobacterium aquaticum]
MLAPATRIRLGSGRQDIGLEIELISHDNLIDFPPPQVTHAHEALAGILVGREDQRASVSRAVCQGIGCRHDVHLAITHLNIAVASDTPKVLVFMFVGSIDTQKIAVTNHQIKQRIRVAVGIFGIAAEHIVDSALAMPTTWNLAIAIEIIISTGIPQSFQFKSVQSVNQPEIRIGDTAWYLCLHA